MNKLRIPNVEIINAIVILPFCFIFPWFIFDLENPEIKWLYVLTPLYLVGFFSIYKIYKNCQSDFIFSSLSIAEKHRLIKRLGDKKHFKILNTENDNFIKLNYQKFALGLRYEVQFLLTDTYFEYNAISNFTGVFDFGTRSRILSIVKTYISSNINSSASL